MSKNHIPPQKILLMFDETCPACGFDLETVLGCAVSLVPAGAESFTSPECSNIDHFRELSSQVYESTFIRTTKLPLNQQPSIKTGVDLIDKVLVLNLGQLVALQGETANRLSLLLCARSLLYKQSGLGSVLFLDGGNIFQSYLISEFSEAFGLLPEEALKRIHLSRAFTYHQLHSLITDKLSLALDESKAKLVVVSDITQLYCDADVRDKAEAFNLLTKSVQCLRIMAERKNALIIATSLKSRNRNMDGVLMSVAHVSARLENKGTLTRLTVERHAFNTERHVVMPFDSQTLIEGC